MRRSGNQPLAFSAGAFLRMAAPMIISRAGLAAMGIADAIMVSRHDARNFACLSLADGTLGRLLDVCVAFFIGGLSLVPRHFARGDVSGAAVIYRRTIPVAVALATICLMASFFGKAALTRLGQPADLAAGAAPVMKILAAGYPAAMLAICAAVYLEGVDRPKLVAIAVVSANLLNVALNYCFIGGRFGLPAMGACGSALGTTIVRCMLGVVLVTAAMRYRAGGTAGVGRAAEADANRKGDANHEADANHDSRAHRLQQRASARMQWRLGMGAASTVAVMVALWSCLTIFAGRLGVMSLATFSAACSLAAPVGLVALGLSDATGIFVSAEAGRGGGDRGDDRGDDRSAASVTWPSLRIVMGIVGTLVFFLATFAGVFAGVYARNPQVRGALAAILPMVAVNLLADSIGFVMSASLRGLREVAWPAGIEIAAMVLLVPLAAELAFGQGLGVRGLFIAMLAAGSIRAAALTARFCWRVRRVAAPIALVTEVLV